MAFLLSSMVLRGKAGKAEFTDEFVLSEESQAMQLRVETEFSPEIDAMGHDRIRSRVEVITKDGRKIEKWANENYRGSPHNPLSNEELEGKFKDCAEGLLDDDRTRVLLDMIWKLDDQADATVIYEHLDWRSARSK